MRQNGVTGLGKVGISFMQKKNLTTFVVSQARTSRGASVKKWGARFCANL